MVRPGQRDGPAYGPELGPDVEEDPAQRVGRGRDGPRAGRRAEQPSGQPVAAVAVQQPVAQGPQVVGVAPERRNREALVVHRALAAADNGEHPTRVVVLQRAQGSGDGRRVAHAQAGDDRTGQRRGRARENAFALHPAVGHEAGAVGEADAVEAQPDGAFSEGRRVGLAPRPGQVEQQPWRPVHGAPTTAAKVWSNDWGTPTAAGGPELGAPASPRRARGRAAGPSPGGSSGGAPRRRERAPP